MIISFDIMNENDHKIVFLDPPISTVQSKKGKKLIIPRELLEVIRYQKFLIA